MRKPRNLFSYLTFFRVPSRVWNSLYQVYWGQSRQEEGETERERKREAKKAEVPASFEKKEEGGKWSGEERESYSYLDYNCWRDLS